MHTSILHIEVIGFGQIQQVLSLPLRIAFETSSLRVSELRDRLCHDYPEAKAALSVCACAIGDRLVPDQEFISSSCQIVLLSPVSGG